MKSLKIILILIFVTSILSVDVFAQEGDTGFRNITTFGCHLNDGTCYFSIDGGAVGAPECLSSVVRFNSQDPVNGKTWLSLLQIAISTGKRIKLNIRGCYSFQPTYPTFTWGQIEVA